MKQGILFKSAMSFLAHDLPDLRRMLQLHNQLWRKGGETVKEVWRRWLQGMTLADVRGSC